MVERTSAKFIKLCVQGKAESMLGLMMRLEEALGGSAGTLFLVQIHQP